MNKLPLPKEYIKTLSLLKQRIRDAQKIALREVNKQLIQLYWDIGRIIYEKQDEDSWGTSVVESLAEDLQKEFSGISGFSVQNLWYMKRFYKEYCNDIKLQPLVGEIGWSHNIIILEKCKTSISKEFYIRLSIREGWSKRVLIEKIKLNEFEKWALQQHNFDQTLPISIAKQATQIIKDDYNFDFLFLSQEHEERDLEDALVHNIVAFLAEMGGNFTFIGRQQKVTVGENDYYIDLLFYHRKLRCLVAIELKADEFKPEYGGKMQFYLSALDSQTKLENENPSIGIIICKKKDRTIVEYTLRDVKRPIGVGTYNRYANLKEVPAEIARYLPSEEELQKRLSISDVIVP